MFLANLLILTLQSQVLVDHYVFAPNITSGNNLLTDLEAMWRFEETSGNPQDSSGNARHLTHFGTVESASGILGNSRAHDSSEDDDYFSAASDTWNTFAGNDFTIAYWFLPDGASGIPEDQAHVSKTDMGGEVSWTLGIDNGASYAFNNAVTFYASDTGDPTEFLLSSPPLNLTVEFTELIESSTVWYCVVLTRSGNDWTLYLGKQGEGSFMGSATTTQALTLFDNSSCPLSIGAFFSGAPALHPNQDTEGEIDEVAIWSRALPECEILKYFNSGIGRSFVTFDNLPCL